jgi:hypothetical protein
MQRRSAQESLTLSLHDQAVELSFPQSIAEDVKRLFSSHGATAAQVQGSVAITEEDNGYAIFADDDYFTKGLARDQALLLALEEVTKALITRLSSAVALHAAAIACGETSVLIPGVSGSGKSSLAAWLVDNGFDYLTDEIALLLKDNGIVGLPRAVVLKPLATEAISSFSAFEKAQLIGCGSHLLGVLPQAETRPRPRRVGLIVFPQYEPDARIKIQSMSPGEVGLKLIACNLNARNLSDGGLASIASLARKTPAVALRYGEFEQLKGTLDVIIRLVVERNLGVLELRRLLNTLSSTQQEQAVAISERRYSVPEPTPRKDDKAILTVGMTTYDDYDGAYFSIQALRLYHQDVLEDVEFLLIDNHPDGACSKSLKDLEACIPNYRYVPKNLRHGTAAREHVFEEASGEFVLCMDSHVFLVPGALRRLLQYCEANSETADLLQGPLLGDDLKALSTHFEPKWRDGMFGHWALDERGCDPDGAPFEIPMQGLGVFACRKAVWPSFNPDFRGFGGEEGYIHEKFRQRSGRTLCLPFLRWVHRFNRPMGVPYPNSWHDRVRNYVIGFQELGLPTNAIEEHFREFLGDEAAQSIFRLIRSERAYSSTRSAPLSRSIATACSTS